MQGRSQKTLFTSLAVFFASIILYTLTLYRTVPGGDSGELITAAHVLGAAHPPGYPLYTLIAHLFTLLPVFPKIAARVNFMSAFFDASAAGLLTFSSIKASEFFFEEKAAPFIGIFTGAMFAFSPSIWSYATQAEVFPLNNFFIALVIALSVHYLGNPSAKIRNSIYIVSGFALFHQQTFLFCFLPLIGWTSLREKKSPLLLTGLGALPLIYLPLANHASFGWGELSTLKGFFIHILREEYGTFQLGTSVWTKSAPFSHLWLYLQSIPKNTPGIFFILAIPGMWISHRKLSWMPIAFFSYLITFIFLSNIDLSVPLYRGVEARFWQQLDIFLFFWMGLGLAWLGRHYFKLAAAVAILASIAQASIGFPKNNRSKNTLVEDYARVLLESVEPHSLLIVTSDIAWNATQYLQLCEHYRTDVQVVSQEMLTYVWTAEKIYYRHPDIILPGKFYLSGKEPENAVARYDDRYLSGNYSMLQFLDANSKKFPIYLAFEFKPADQQEILNRYQRVSLVFLDRVFPKGTQIDRTEWKKRGDEIITKLSSDNVVTYPEETWEYYLNQLITVQKYRYQSTSD
jgi:hypothetical protein